VVADSWLLWLSLKPDEANDVPATVALSAEECATFASVVENCALLDLLADVARTLVASVVL